MAQLLYWAAGSVINYVLIPMLVVKLYLREHIADFGLKFRGIWRSSWLYLAMFLVMIGPLAFFSRTDGLPGSAPVLSHLARRAVLASAARLDLGSGVYLPILRPGVFLSRFPAARASAPAGVLRDIRNDGAVLHDPLPEADAGVSRSYRGRGHFGIHEPEDAVDLARRVPARGRGAIDGFSRALAPRDAVASPPNYRRSLGYALRRCK